jgi:tetratricopeptide (TPR) repeat protein
MPVTMLASNAVFMQNRLEQLLHFVENEPQEPFNHYALALEYEKSDLPKALERYGFLLTQFPDYLPAYYQAAGLWYRTGEAQKAKEVYQKGIALAKEQGKLKIQKELQQALQLLLEDD